MAAHAAEIAGQRQHRMVTKGDANGNGPQSRSDPKGRRRDVSLKDKHCSRRVVTAGNAVSWHDRIRVPAAAHDMDEAWGRACSTTYSLPILHARPPQQRSRIEGGRCLRLWIEVGAQTATTQTERGRSEEAMMAAHAAEIAGQRQHRMATKGRCKRKGTTVAIRSKRTSSRRLAQAQALLPTCCDRR